ncbi:MAG: apolipoprotein N-acyltransferase [Gammaproteobacteria bacterium]|nr:apolipoprotein N-acyltransferase [Gammaproteobacteria bacterium]
MLSLAGLVWLLGAEPTSSWKKAGLSGWIFATSWLCGTFWWLFISMHTYGGLPAVLAGAAVFALAAALAIYYAIACAWFKAVAPRGRWAGSVLFAALWTLAELVRGSWFTGFPWGAGGYAHVEGPLAAYAPWLGVYGIGALTAFIAALPALSMRQGERRASSDGFTLAFVVAVLGIPMALAAVASKKDDVAGSSGTIEMALLQGNIPQDVKFVPGEGIPTALRWYGNQLMESNAALVITPETALPLLPSQLPPGYLDAIAKRYANSGQAAIVGLPMQDGAGYSNSVLGFGADATVQYRYDKHHLVPFGEFIPGMFKWFTDMMNIPLGDFRRGSLAQPSFHWQGQRIAPNICYEDLFGDEIGANFRREAVAPTILLNVSNIAWFGDSIAIDQHLLISRMRALEFDRPMVRSTNTGATAIIDHHGRVTQSLTRLTRGVLTATVEGRNGLTLYAMWVSRFGLWPLWGAMAIAVAVVSLSRRSTARP